MSDIHYVNNKELYAAMVEYIRRLKEAKEKGQEKPEVPRYIAECILKIATRLSLKHNYRNNRDYHEEMIMDGVENCLRYIHNFNPEKSNNPFAYFTQIIVNAFLRRIDKEKTEHYVKHITALQYDVIIDEGDDGYDDGDVRHHGATDKESISDFVKSFEDRAALKKEKRKKTLAKKAESALFEEKQDEDSDNN